MSEKNGVIAELSIGTLFEDRYLITKILGEGGQGVVVKALDKKNYDNPVVIKALKKDASDKWSADKFKEEQRALAQLQSATGIVKLIDGGKTKNGLDYTILEFVDGALLTSLIADLPGNLPRAAALFQQIASAVEFAHLREIYHRDLKPDNIMVANPNSRAELVKIIDFGIAKQTVGKLTNIELTSNIVGTPFYISPNALDGKPDAKADDIYALGMIAYILVTGSYPISTADFSFPKLLNMQKEIDRYPPSEKNESLSKQVDEVILKALSENPSKRYSSAEEFGDELRRALFQPVGEKTTLLSIPMTDEKRKSRAVFFVIPLLLTGIFLALLLGWRFLGSDKTPETASNASAQNTNRATGSASENKPADLSRDSSNMNAAAIPAFPKSARASVSGALAATDLSVELVKQTESGASVPTSASQTFRTGDGIRLNISSAQNGFLQIFLKDNDGKVQRVLNSEIVERKPVSFPSPQWIFFDDEPGTETIYVVVSNPRAPEKTDVDSLDEQSGGSLEFTTEKGSAVKIIRLNHGR